MEAVQALDRSSLSKVFRTKAVNKFVLIVKEQRRSYTCGNEGRGWLS